MYPKSRYHIQYKDNDLIYLPELMLRWPYECYVKICHELFHENLKLYIATEKYLNNKKEIVDIIMKFPPQNFTFDYLLKLFSSIVSTF